MRIPNDENFQSYIIDSFESLTCFSVSGQPRVCIYAHTEEFAESIIQRKTSQTSSKELTFKTFIYKGFYCSTQQMPEMGSLSLGQQKMRKEPPSVFKFLKLSYSYLMRFFFIPQKQCFLFLILQFFSATSTRNYLFNLVS